MAGAVGDDMSFDGITDQGQVADHIQQFVPGGFIGEPQFQVVQISSAFDLHIVPSKGLGQPVHFFFRHFFVDDHDGIIDIAAL